MVDSNAVVLVHVQYGVSQQIERLLITYSRNVTQRELQKTSAIFKWCRPMLVEGVCSLALMKPQKAKRCQTEI